MPAAGNTGRSVNFERLTVRWNEMVHEQAEIENRSKADRIYYKLPEHLERHHKLWVQARATRATLVNSAENRQTITEILSDPARRSRVLPAITLPFIPALKNNEMVTVNKGKEKAVVSAIEPVQSSSGPHSQPVVHTSSTQASSSKPSLIEPKVKARKRCAPCRDAKCPRADTCAGRGNRQWCTCTNHSQPKNPRSKNN